MPLYSYHCESCGHNFDKIVQKMDDSPQPCEKCGHMSVQVMSVPAPFQWGKGAKL